MKRNAVYQLAVTATVAAVFVVSAPLCASGADVPSPTNAPGLVGGSPASCGYSWLPDRQGWLGPDGTTFVPANDKPEWAAYIPANKADTKLSPIVKPVESAVVKPVAAPATEVKQVAAPTAEVKQVAAPVKEVRQAGQPPATAPAAPAGK